MSHILLTIFSKSKKRTGIEIFEKNHPAQTMHVCIIWTLLDKIWNAIKTSMMVMMMMMTMMMMTMMTMMTMTMMMINDDEEGGIIMKRQDFAHRWCYQNFSLESDEGLNIMIGQSEPYWSWGLWWSPDWNFGMIAW